MPSYSHVSRNLPTRCSVQRANGDFCDADSAPDMPFAICAHHAIQVYARMQAIVTESRTNHRQYVDTHNGLVKAVADERQQRQNTPSHVVYYVKVGKLIKIGTTAGPIQVRMAKYPPGSELLAVEHGGLALEAQRHREFSTLLAERKEWFRPGPALLDHIAGLRKAR